MQLNKIVHINPRLFGLCHTDLILQINFTNYRLRYGNISYEIHQILRGVGAGRIEVAYQNLVNTYGFDNVFSFVYRLNRGDFK